MNRDEQLPREPGESVGHLVKRVGVLRERHAYWKVNVRLVLTLLAIWFLVSYGAGILFRDALDAWRIPGTSFPLGFWFAQQGAIFTFVAIIWVYAWLMNRVDRDFGVDEE